MAQQTQGITLVDGGSINAALQEVRADSSSTNWALVTYHFFLFLVCGDPALSVCRYDGPNNNALTLLGKGDGGVDELISNLKDNILVQNRKVTIVLFELQYIL